MTEPVSDTLRSPTVSVPVIQEKIFQSCLKLPTLALSDKSPKSPTSFVLLEALSICELDDESWQPPAGEAADPERTALESERTRALTGALAAITDGQRAAIVLFDVEGYDYGEIAEMTGVSLGTVKSRIHRGRLALRGLLEDRMELFRG